MGLRLGFEVLPQVVPDAQSGLAVPQVGHRSLFVVAAQDLQPGRPIGVQRGDRDPGGDRADGGAVLRNGLRVSLPDEPGPGIGDLITGQALKAKN